MMLLLTSMMALVLSTFISIVVTSSGSISINLIAKPDLRVSLMVCGGDDGGGGGVCHSLEWTSQTC